MATDRWTAAAALSNELLLQNSKSFSFFQAVEILEAAVPNSVPVGYQGPPEREAVRFRPNASLGFPSCDVESIEARHLKEGELSPLSNDR